MVFTALFDQFERFLFFAFRIKKFLHLKVNLLEPVQGKKKIVNFRKKFKFFLQSTHNSEHIKNSKKKSLKTRFFDGAEQ